MKTLLIIGTACLLILQSQSTVSAQGKRGQGATQGQVPPLFRIFDADSNGVLEPTEIANAAKAIEKLDSNQDGKVTPEEFRAGGGQAGRGQGATQGPQRGGGQAKGGSGGGKKGGDKKGGGKQGGRPGGQTGGKGAPGGQGGGGRGGDPAQADAQFAKQVMELDENRNKEISSDELPEHMQAAFNIADADKNGSLEQKEVLVLAAQFRRNKLSPEGENTEMKNRPTGGEPKSRR